MLVISSQSTNTLNYQRMITRGASAFVYSTVMVWVV